MLVRVLAGLYLAFHASSYFVSSDSQMPLWAVR
jgi:hypothetical protein